jgi:hypothetical protein
MLPHNKIKEEVRRHMAVVPHLATHPFLVAHLELAREKLKEEKTRATVAADLARDRMSL